MNKVSEICFKSAFTVKSKAGSKGIYFVTYSFMNCNSSGFTDECFSFTG